MNFTADMVKPLRDRLNMTQEAFAKEIGCGVRVVSKWENGKVKNINGAHRKAMIRLQLYLEAKL